MNKLFNRIFWHNNTTPALNESNLNAMSKGIDDIDNRVVDLAGDIMETIPQLEEDLETAQELIDDLEDLNEHTPYIGANGNWWVWNTTTKEYEDSGVDASISVQIADITMLAPSATPYVTNSGTNTDPVFHLFIPRGHGVASVTKTSTSGLVDTYTMTFTDGTSTTFTVTNGKTAYQSAQDGGYTGTESQFNTTLANLPTYASDAAQSAQDASGYANNASGYANDASGYATAASGSASAADGSAEDAEAWAVGTRDGVPVSSDDPTYHNNAKYWSDQSAGQRLDSLSDVEFTNLSDGQGIYYDALSQKWVNKGSNIKLDDVSSVSASVLGGNITLVWSDPDDITISDHSLATWAGTRVVRKAGSIPQNVNDGTLVVNNTVRNQYSSSGYVDTVTEVGTTYYYRFFPYTTDYNYTYGTSVDAETFDVFGAEWDGTSTTAWSRTDGAVGFPDPVSAVNNGNGNSPFDSLMPWKGMRRVTDADAGELVEIPKFYYKWTRDGVKMKLQISMTQKEGFLCSPAHADRGDGSGERDYVYVGRYHCSSTNYKSMTGVTPKATMTRANFRTNIHNIGSKIWQYDYAMYWTIAMLYLVEFADWDSQKKIGYGCGNSTSVENCGLTDSMTYHTGTNATNRTTYGHTQYRYIEDLWGNVYDWCDGIYFSSTNVYAIKNPSSFSDTTGGTLVGTRSNTSGCISAWNNPNASGFEYALYPSAIVSDNTCQTYISDYCSYSANAVCLRIGSNYSTTDGRRRGLFNLNGNNIASYTHNGTGSRLQKLP